MKETHVADVLGQVSESAFALPQLQRHSDPNGTLGKDPRSRSNVLQFRLRCSPHDKYRAMQSTRPTRILSQLDPISPTLHPPTRHSLISRNARNSPCRMRIPWNYFCEKHERHEVDAKCRSHTHIHTRTRRANISAEYRGHGSCAIPPRCRHYRQIPSYVVYTVTACTLLLYRLYPAIRRRYEFKAAAIPARAWRDPRRCLPQISRFSIRRCTLLTGYIAVSAALLARVPISISLPFPRPTNFSRAASATQAQRIEYVLPKQRGALPFLYGR